MVIGLLAITAIPTVTGVGQAVSAQKKENREAKQQEKFHITAVWEANREEHETPFCILKDKRVIVNLTGEDPIPGYPFCGYYFTYPGPAKHLGMVSTVSDDPPMLNWIFVNRDTRALEFGSRKETLEHVIGPWGWSDDEAYVTLQGSEDGFVARWEDDVDVNGKDNGKDEGRWAVYWDPEGEMLTEQRGECMAVKLRRRPLLGVESRYVRD